MLYSTSWREFVIYPLTPERGDSYQSRTDTSQAFRKKTDGSLPEEYHNSPNKGIIVEQKDVERQGDSFQALAINPYGNVFIWTNRHIWTISRTGKNQTLEKLHYIPLNHKHFNV